MSESRLAKTRRVTGRRVVFDSWKPRHWSPRFKSLIKKSLFILIVYSWPLAYEVTWPHTWEGLQYINQNKNNSSESKTDREVSKSRCGVHGLPLFQKAGVVMRLIWKWIKTSSILSRKRIRIYNSSRLEIFRCQRSNKDY